MRSKSVFVLAAFMAIILISGADAFGQIQWLDSPTGVGVSSSTPGKATNDTLRIILGEFSQLTNTQWLEIDLSSFQVDETAAATAANYSFSSNNAGLQMNNSTDFSAGYTSSTSVVRLTLVTENALVPGDTVTVVIQNVTTHNGKTSSGASSDYRFRVRSSDQPVFQSDADTDNLLTTPNYNNLTAVTNADTLAQNTNWATLRFTANGQYPKDGELKVILPDGFTYDGTLNDSVTVTVAGSPNTLGTISTSGRTMTIPLNA